LALDWVKETWHSLAVMNAHSQISNVPQPVRLKVEDFLLLDENGAFADYSKTELIDGEIFGMNAQHSWHARTKTLLATELNIALRALGSDLEAWAEPSTRISDHSLPEPDVVVTRHRGRGVVPLETVALLVEVSDTTLDIDLGRKLRMYAEAGIAEYWVIDMTGDRAIRMWEPTGNGFARQDVLALGEHLQSVTIEGLTVATEK
jgi:Uma2 family endonuclease